MITKVANNPAVQCLQTNLCCVVTLVAILFGACVFIYVKMPRDQNKNLTDEQRRDMLWFLQQRASAENKNGLKRNAMKDAAIHFECTGYSHAETPAIRLSNCDISSHPVVSFLF